VYASQATQVGGSLRTILLFSVLLIAADPATARRIPVTCSPEYGAGGSTWFRGEGLLISHADGFPACDEGARWNSVYDIADWMGTTFRAEGRVESAEGAVTVATELGLELAEGADSSGDVVMQVEALFTAPLGLDPVPAEVVVWIQREGGLDIFDLYGRVDGPALMLVGLGALAPGEHRFPVELEPGATYEVFLDVGGALTDTGSGTASIRLAVDSPLPEAGGSLQIAIGALVLAFCRPRKRRSGSLNGRSIL